MIKPKYVVLITKKKKLRALINFCDINFLSVGKIRILNHKIIMLTFYIKKISFSVYGNNQI